MKCPNCNQEIRDGAEYCMACGYRLSASIRVPKKEAEGSGAVKMEASCPNGHPVSDPGLGFCEICGAPLRFAPKKEDGKHEPDGPDTVPIIVGDKPAPEPVLREIVCPSCRMKFKDGKLSYCPVCGYPLKSAAAGRPAEPKRIEWRCGICGFTNNDESGFCVACGNARGAVADDRRPGEERHEHEDVFKGDPSGSSALPSGMHAPGSESLVVKHNYGKPQR